MPRISIADFESLFKFIILYYRNDFKIGAYLLTLWGEQIFTDRYEKFL